MHGRFPSDAPRYVAMGSSFGAGPGLRPRAPMSPRSAGRSANNYAHLVAGELGLDLVDVTYSGMTVRDLLDGRGRVAPQVAAVNPATSLVTITAGGNDIGYLPVLTLASLPSPWSGIPAVRRRIERHLDREELEVRLRRLEVDLLAVVDHIRSVAPEARVLLVDYLTVLPSGNEASPPLRARFAEWGREAARGLSEAMSQAAAGSGAEFVAGARFSRDHHAWSAEPWTRRFHYSLRGGAPYHPNVLGMQNVARLVADRVSGPRRPPPPGGGPGKLGG